MVKRQTRQREAVHRTLRRAGQPLSAAELLDEARRAVTGIGVATVYRHIRTMVDGGHVVVVRIPGEPVRYEWAGKGHHHYFVCDVCDRVFEVPGCASDFGRMTPHGFRLERHEVILYGCCAKCAG